MFQESWLTSKLRNRVASHTTVASTSSSFSSCVDEVDHLADYFSPKSKWPQLVMGMIGASALLALMLRSRDL